MDWSSVAKEGSLTHVVLVFGVTGEVSEEAGERTQLEIVVGPEEIQNDRQHPTLLQRHTTQDGRPLKHKRSFVEASCSCWCGAY